MLQAELQRCTSSSGLQRIEIGDCVVKFGCGEHGLVTGHRRFSNESLEVDKFSLEIGLKVAGQIPNLDRKRIFVQTDPSDLVAITSCKLHLEESVRYGGFRF